MAYSRTRYGTGYYIYNTMYRARRCRGRSAPGTARRRRPRDVLGPDLPARAPTWSRRQTPAGPKARHSEARPQTAPLTPARVTLAEIRDGPSMIRAIRVRGAARPGRRVRPRPAPHDLGQSPRAVRRRARGFVLRGRHALQPGRPRIPGERLSRSMCASRREQVRLACYFPMPFFRRHAFELIDGLDRTSLQVSWADPLPPYNDPPSHVGYFHATYRDHPNPEPGQGLGPPRHARQPKAAATGRATSWACPGSSRTVRCWTRWKAIPGSSSTTAGRRRPRAPARRSGAAAAITGAAGT